MGTPDDCHSGLGFGGILLAMCILELDFPVRLAAQLRDGAPGSQHTARAVPQPSFKWCLSLTVGSVWAWTLMGFSFVPAG